MAESFRVGDRITVGSTALCDSRSNDFVAVIHIWSNEQDGECMEVKERKTSYLSEGFPITGDQPQLCTVGQHVFLQFHETAEIGKDFVHAIVHALSRIPEDHGLLIHCRSGQVRSPWVAAIRQTVLFGKHPYEAICSVHKTLHEQTGEVTEIKPLLMRAFISAWEEREDRHGWNPV